MIFPKNKNRGFFTLIGLLLAVVIIAIWAAAVMPKHFGTAGNNASSSSPGNIIDPATGAVIPDPRGAIQKAKDTKALLEKQMNATQQVE